MILHVVVFVCLYSTG